MTDTTYDFHARVPHNSPVHHARGPVMCEFPPDFLHGEATLDELYDAFGERWAERVAFVQHHVMPGGTLRGASVARFNDWFLAISHATVEDVGGTLALHGWVEEQLLGREVVVELSLHPMAVEGRSKGGWIDIACAPDRLLELEQQVLHVHREGSDWITYAETNLLSLVTLCARLGLDF